MSQFCLLQNESRGLIIATQVAAECASPYATVASHSKVVLPFPVVFQKVGLDISQLQLVTFFYDFI